MADKSKDKMTPGHVRGQTFPDPNEPQPEMAGTTIALILGIVAVLIIIVMITSFIYFQATVGASTFVLPV